MYYNLLAIKFFSKPHSPSPPQRYSPTVPMTSLQVETFLQQQTMEYQHHLSNKDKVTKMLQYQHNIQTYRSVPKHYFPLNTPETRTDEPTLTKELQDKYKQLFFRHLDKIIIHNTITLELETARLEAIVAHVEQHLTTLNVPSHILSQQHHQFLSRNITNHNTPTQLQKLLITDKEPVSKEPTSCSDVTTAKPTSGSTTHSSTSTH